MRKGLRHVWAQAKEFRQLINRDASIRNLVYSRISMSGTAWGAGKSSWVSRRTGHIGLIGWAENCWQQRTRTSCRHIPVTKCASNRDCDYRYSKLGRPEHLYQASGVSGYPGSTSFHRTRDYTPRVSRIFHVSVVPDVDFSQIVATVLQVSLGHRCILRINTLYVLYLLRIQMVNCILVYFWAGLKHTSNTPNSPEYSAYLRCQTALQAFASIL